MAKDFGSDLEELRGEAAAGGGAGAPARVTKPDYRAKVREASLAAGLDPDLVARLVTQESAWDPYARSHRGAVGLMQLMPATAKALGVNPRNPDQNIKGGVELLKRLMAKYKREDLALAAYNAGEPAVDRYKGIPPYRETQDYVRKILGGSKTAAAPQRAAAPKPAPTGMAAAAPSPEEAMWGRGDDFAADLEDIRRTGPSDSFAADLEAVRQQPPAAPAPSAQPSAQPQAPPLPPHLQEPVTPPWDPPRPGQATAQRTGDVLLPTPGAATQPAEDITRPLQPWEMPRPGQQLAQRTGDVALRPSAPAAPAPPAYGVVPDPTATLGERALDIGITAAKGVVGVGEAAVGLLDIPTFGWAGKLLQDKLGYDPQQTRQILDSYLSDPQRQANLNVQVAHGFVDKAAAALANPSVIAHTVGESLPLMLGGAAAARGLLTKVPALGPLVAGAIGEGLATAGSAAEQTRQASPTGTLTPGQAGLAVAAGAATGAIGAIGGRIARALGIDDVDTMLAAAARDGNARRGLATAIVAGAFTEGVLEELPQSVQEQVLQNYAQGRPLMEGVDDAAVLGTLAGAVMGGGANAYTGVTTRPDTSPEASVEQRVRELTDQVRLRQARRDVIKRIVDLALFRKNEPSPLATAFAQMASALESSEQREAADAQAADAAFQADVEALAAKGPDLTIADIFALFEKYPDRMPRITEGERPAPPQEPTEELPPEPPPIAPPPTEPPPPPPAAPPIEPTTKLPAEMTDEELAAEVMRELEAEEAAAQPAPAPEPPPAAPEPELTTQAPTVAEPEERFPYEVVISAPPERQAEAQALAERLGFKSVRGVVAFRTEAEARAYAEEARRNLPTADMQLVERHEDDSYTPIDAWDGTPATQAPGPEKPKKRLAAPAQEKPRTAGKDEGLFQRVLDDARRISPNVNEQELRDEFIWRMSYARDQQAEAGSGDTSPIGILRLIAEAGGIDSALPGDAVKTLKEGMGPGGALAGVSGVFRKRVMMGPGHTRSGHGLDKIAELLRERGQGRLDWIEGPNEVLKILDDATRKGAQGAPNIRDLMRLAGLTGRWWENPQRPMPEAPVERGEAYDEDIPPEAVEAIDFGEEDDEDFTERELKNAKRRQQNEQRRRETQAPLLDAADVLPPLPTLEEYAENTRALGEEWTEKMQRMAENDLRLVAQYRQELLDEGVPPTEIAYIEEHAKETYPANYLAGILGDHLRAIKAGRDPLGEVSEKAAPFTWYRSGQVDQIADFDGLTDNNLPIGITVRGLSQEMRARAVAYAKRGGKVFVDSGAAAKPILEGRETLDFAKVLNTYAEMADEAGAGAQNLMVVAPDKVGDYEGTITALDRYHDSIQALIDRGVNVIIAAQQGGPSLATIEQDYTRRFGEKFVLGVAFNKAAWPNWQVSRAITDSPRQHVRIHLLGTGERNQRVINLREALPFVLKEANKTIDLSGDSTEVRAVSGRGRKIDPDTQAEKLDEAADNLIGTEPQFDDTEVIGYMNDLSDAEVQRLARYIGMTPEAIHSALITRTFWKQLEAAGVHEDAVVHFINAMIKARATKAAKPDVRREAVKQATAPTVEGGAYGAAAKAAYKGFKTRLTRLANAKQHQAVIALWEEFQQFYDTNKFPYPDAWRNWERAAEDAQYALDRERKQGHFAEPGKPVGPAPAERPRRNAIGSHALEDRLSPPAQQALAVMFKKATAGRDLRRIREAMEVYHRLLEMGDEGRAQAEAVRKATEAFFLNMNPDTASDVMDATWEGLQKITGEEDPDPAELLENEVFASAHEAGELVFQTLDERTASFNVEEFNTAFGEVEFRREPDEVFPPVPEDERVNLWKGRKTRDTISHAEGAAKIEQWKALAKKEGERAKSAHEKLVIISLYDRTGIISQPWRDAGYHVVQYDIRHGQDLIDFGDWMGDIEELIAEGYTIEGVLAQPPCTSFTLSGTQHWPTKHDAPNREWLVRTYGARAAEYFDTPVDYANTLVAVVKLVVAQANPKFYMMENPVGRIGELNHLPDPVLKFHPDDYGEPYTKATQLWGEFNPNLPTARVHGEKEQGGEGSRTWNLSSADKDERSLTPEGFAYSFFMANHSLTAQMATPKAAPAPEAPAAPPTASAQATVTINAARRSVEVKFEKKPDESVREELKRRGFRWAKTNQVWYKAAPGREDALAAQVRAALGTGEQKAEKPAAPPAEATTVDMGPYTTPGTRVTWSNGREWAQGFYEIDRRRVSAKQYRDLANHLAKLAEVLPGLISQQSVADLRAMREVIEKKGNHFTDMGGGSARAEGSGMESHPITLVKNEVNNELQRRARVLTRAQAIDAIVLNSQPKKQPEVLERFEVKGTDGKWYRAGVSSLPWGVDVAEPREQRSIGWSIQSEQGTAVGTLMPSKQAVLNKWRQGEDKKADDFKAALEQMTNRQLVSQADHWMKETVRIEGEKAPRKEEPPPVSQKSDEEIAAEVMAEAEAEAEPPPPPSHAAAMREQGKVPVDQLTNEQLQAEFDYWRKVGSKRPASIEPRVQLVLDTLLRRATAKTDRASRGYWADRKDFGIPALTKDAIAAIDKELQTAPEGPDHELLLRNKATLEREAEENARRFAENKRKQEHPTNYRLRADPWGTWELWASSKLDERFSWIVERLGTDKAHAEKVLARHVKDAEAKGDVGITTIVVNRREGTTEERRDVEPREPQAKPAAKSFKAEVTDGSGYTSNALRFPTREDAKAYAEDLFSRWMAMKDFRIVESDDPVTHRWDKATYTHVRIEKEDVLDTGEKQPRLPGAGEVREQNIKTPEVGEVPFTLSGERGAVPPPAAIQGGLLEPPTDPDLDARRAENAKKREALFGKLRNKLTANVDPADVVTMVGILRTYIDDGITEGRRAWRQLKHDAPDLATKLVRHFEIAWKKLTGEAVNVALFDDLAPEPAPAPQPEPAQPDTDTDIERARILFDHFRNLSTTKWPTNAREARTMAKDVLGVSMDEHPDVIADALEAALVAKFRREQTSRFEDPLLAEIQVALNYEESLPRAWRSLEKMDLQQFSTPLPIAAAAQRAAQATKGDRVLEPTAGTGSLISSGLDAATIDANELSQRRAGLLRALGGYNVTSDDYLAALGLKDQYDVIITNPPWGKYTTGKYGAPVGLRFTPGDVAERFVAKNARDLKNGGRLVAVMPTTMLRSPGFMQFLKANGAIRAIIQSPPGAYKTRATTVDSLLLVWDKGATDKQAGSVQLLIAHGDRAPATWDEYAYFVERIPPREARDAGTAEEPTGRPAGEPAAPAPRPVGGGGGGTGRPSPQPGPGRPRPVGPAGVPPGGRDPDVVAPPEPGDRRELDRPGSTPRAAREDARDATRGLSPEALVAYRDAQASRNFAPYRLRSDLTGVRHPKLVVEARALSGVPYPELVTEPTDRVRRIIESGRVSIEQAEQALAAVQANIVGRHGYLAADNVGVGKSRELALVIIDLMERAKAEGRPLRLMVTTYSRDTVAGLIEEELMKEVLAGEDPGFEVVKVFDLKDAKKEGTDYKPLPQFEHAIYVVDSFNLREYRQALLDVGLHGVIGDEVHNYKNAKAGVGAAWQTIHGQIMTRVPRAHQAFAYFTATPAQSVYDYQYLYGLREWPIDGFLEWIDVITGTATEDQVRELGEATDTGAFRPEVVTGNTGDTVVGGDSEDTPANQPRVAGRGESVFAQRLSPAEAEQIPREWKWKGKFSSRDLWRAGTEFVIVTRDLKKEHRERYDKFAQLARDIIDAHKQFGALDKSGRRSRYGPNSALQFAAKRLQMQPQIEEAIAIAKEHVAKGYQAVLSLINVNESNPEEGNIRAAIEQINTQQIDKNDDGTFTDPIDIPEAFIRRAELLEQAAALGILDNPIELVTDAFGPQNVALIIGDTGKVRMVHAREFQQGKRPVAVISAAGTTGINLDHRAALEGPEIVEPRTDEKGTHTHDDRYPPGRRVFIDVQYEWSATKAVQRYGRVDRSASLTAPKIAALNFGSASEKKFLATVANRMSSLGALSKGGAESTGATPLEEFEITGQDALLAARNVWDRQSAEDKLAWWRGRVFRDPGNPELPAPNTRADMKQIQLGLLWLPVERANQFWEDFIKERERIREAMGFLDERRARAYVGDILRSVELDPTHTITQVRNDNGERFGILSGLVMGDMPKLVDYLAGPDGRVRRRYVTFTAKDGRVIAGLEIPWTRVKNVARLYGAMLGAEKLDTPEKVREALAAGERLPLGHEPWVLRQRQDGKIAIDNAKMADRSLLQNHGVGYMAVGNFWYVTDLEKFLDRFPVKQPDVKVDDEDATAGDLFDEDDDDTGGGRPRSSRSQSATGQVGPRGPGIQQPRFPVKPANMPSLAQQQMQAQGQTYPAKIRPLEVPELVELVQDLIGLPLRVIPAFRKIGKRGEFRGPQGIRLTADLFKRGREAELAEVLAHEIGHMTDWLPDHLMTRGNLLGRLFSLRKFLKHTIGRPSGGDVELGPIKEELKKLSALWRPWDRSTADQSFIRYRDSSEELYADALSVLLNNPELLRKTAPTFYAVFFETLQRKPDVMQTYFDLQDALNGTPEDVIKRRHGRVMEMFKEGDIRAIEIERARLEERRRVWANFYLRLRQQLVDKNVPIIDRVHEALRRGMSVPQSRDPRYLLEERNHIHGKRKVFIEREIQPIMDALNEADIHWDTFGAALFYERVMADPHRSELANPLGLQPKHAAEARKQEIYDKLSPAQKSVLNKAIEDFRTAMAEVAEKAYDAGLYTPAMYAQMQKNPAYGTYRVLDYIEDPVTSRIIQQIGTTKAIQNVADATILKALATIEATEYNRVKVGTFNFLHHAFPRDIAQAREVQGRPIPPKKHTKLRMVTYMERGRLRGKYVDQFIEASLNNLSHGQNWAIVQGLRFFNNHLFRPIFTAFNPGFQSFNVWRDFWRTWKNTPGMSAARALKRYAQGHRLAKARAFGAPTQPRISPTAGPVTSADQDLMKDWEAYDDLLDAYAAGILSTTQAAFDTGRDTEATQIEELLAQAHIGGYEALLAGHPVLRPVRRILKRVEQVGNYIETLPKAAAIYEYKGKGAVADLTPAQRSHIRRKIGSPDYLAGGMLKPFTNEVLLFSNAITQAWRADLEVATDPTPHPRPHWWNPTTRSGWWWKTMALNVLPKIAIAAAMYAVNAGGGDDDDDEQEGGALRKALRGITEYDLTNYIPVPIGIDELGNVIYVRIPQDDTGRVIGGLVWKALGLARGDKPTMDAALEILNYMGGQAPTVTPSIGAARDTIQILRGQNIYDSYRGRFILSDDELHARDSRAWEKFAGYEFGQLGGDILWKFRAGESPTREKSGLQDVLDLPVVSNTAGRWVRATNYGEVEKLRAVGSKIEQGKARMRLDERDLVTDAVKRLRKGGVNPNDPGPITTEARRIVQELYTDKPLKDQREQYSDIVKKLRMGLNRGEADPITQSVLQAASGDEKAAIIISAGEAMSEKELNFWLTRAMQNRVISKDVYARVRRLQQQRTH